MSNFTKLLATSLTALTVASTPVAATTIKIHLAGAVEYLYGTPATEFHISQPVFATLRYHSDQVGSDFYGDGIVHYFPESVKNFGTIQVGSNKITLNDARMFVTDNEAGGSIDRFIYEDHSPAGKDVGGLALQGVFFNWQAGAATGSGFALPSTQSELDRYGYPVAAIDYSNDPTDGSGRNRIQVLFTSAEVTAVPEPSTWLMLIAGFALTGAAIRSRARRDMSLVLVSGLAR